MYLQIRLKNLVLIRKSQALFWNDVNWIKFESPGMWGKKGSLIPKKHFQWMFDITLLCHLISAKPVCLYLPQHLINYNRRKVIFYHERYFH